MRQSQLSSIMVGYINFVDDSTGENGEHDEETIKPKFLTKLEQWTETLEMKFDGNRYKIQLFYLKKNHRDTEYGES